MGCYANIRVRQCRSLRKSDSSNARRLGSAVGRGLVRTFSTPAADMTDWSP